MGLQEQLEKIENDLRKNEEKRKALLEKKKKIEAMLELELAQKEAEKKQRIVSVIEENFGEITEENLDILRMVMREQKDQITRRKEQLERNSNE